MRSPTWTSVALSSNPERCGQQDKSLTREVGGQGRREWGTEKALGGEEREKAEVWVGRGAGYPYPTHRQCEIGNPGPQPPLKSLNAFAEGRRGLKKDLGQDDLPSKSRSDALSAPVPSMLSICITAVCRLHRQCPGGFGSCWLRLSQASHRGVGLCQAVSSPTLHSEPALHSPSHPALPLLYSCVKYIAEAPGRILDPFSLESLQSTLSE